MAYIVILGMRQSAMEKCPLMKQFASFTLLQRIHNRKELCKCKGSVKNFNGDCQLTVHQRFQTGEKTFECKNMERHIFVPHTLFSMSKFTPMRHLINAEN